MMPADFLPDKNVPPWCPDIHNGKLQPRRYPQFHYTHGWVIKGVKGRFSSPVPKHWRCCPICARERPTTHACDVTHRWEVI